MEGERRRDWDYDKRNISVVICDTDILQRLTLSHDGDRKPFEMITYTVGKKITEKKLITIYSLKKSPVLFIYQNVIINSYDVIYKINIYA